MAGARVSGFGRAEFRTGRWQRRRPHPVPQNAFPGRRRLFASGPRLVCSLHMIVRHEARNRRDLWELCGKIPDMACGC